MPLDDIAGAAIGALGRFILWIFLQVIFEIVCFYIGRYFLLIISLGQYKRIIGSVKGGTMESVIGLVILVLMILYITN